jgi:predicted nucleic acid-binding protein
MMKKALDTNIIVYSLLENHPASEICEKYIRDENYTFYTTPLTPFEIYFVLRKIYGVNMEKSAEKALSLFETPLIIEEITAGDAEAPLKKCVQHNIDTNDGFLLQLSLKNNVPSIASDDQKLLSSCQNEDLLPQSPINSAIKSEMNIWENENLPERGLARILKRIHLWLMEHDAENAKKFAQATNNLKQLPV